MTQKSTSKVQKRVCFFLEIMLLPSYTFLPSRFRNKIKTRQYVFSKHAVDQSITRNISVDAFERALSDHIEIIEDYPQDKYGPSCLVLGFMTNGKALHVVCAYPDAGSPLKVITLYEPDTGLWKNHRIRKERDEQ